MKHKSHNPFKMWESYLGLAIVVYISILFHNSYISWASNLLGAFGTWSSSGFLLVFFIIPYVVINLGFLLGWGIHVLLKKAKK